MLEVVKKISMQIAFALLLVVTLFFKLIYAVLDEALNKIKNAYKARF